MIENLADILEQQVKEAVDQAVQKHVASIIQQLSLDAGWISKIEKIVNDNYAQKFEQYLSTVDVGTLIEQHIDQGLDRWRDKLVTDFQTRGIHDMASDLRLIVEDGQVTVATAMAVPDITVDNDINVAGTLVVKNLVVKGSINTDNRSWEEIVNLTAQKTNDLMTDVWRESLVSDVLEISKIRGINFNDVLLDGLPLVSGNELNRRIQHTSISKLGVVEDLETKNTTNLCGTLYVTNGRIGVNTTTPDMAVNVWDQEVSVSIGKYAANSAYIGTSRKQAVTIGVNRQPAVEIDEEGLTRIRQLRVDRWRIGHSTQVPGHSGTRGDIVFNNNPVPNSPFAWICLGAFQWKPIGMIS